MAVPFGFHKILSEGRSMPVMKINRYVILKGATTEQRKEFDGTTSLFTPIYQKIIPDRDRLDFRYLLRYAMTLLYSMSKRISK